MTPASDDARLRCERDSTSQELDIARLRHWIDHPSDPLPFEDPNELAADVARCQQLLITSGCTAGPLVAKALRSIDSDPITSGIQVDEPAPFCSVDVPVLTDKDTESRDPISSQFTALEFVGAGSFGIVFRAHDERLGRDVAVKILRPSRGHCPNARRRFLREAQAVSGLDHPGIARVFEAGTLSGQPYITTAFVNGLTLSDFLKQQGPLNFRAAAALMAQVADAVNCAHSHGVLHRDLKPSNILLKPAEPGRSKEFEFRPQITDFGLAKKLESGSPSDLFTTRNGAVVGTLHYMSPEQATGRTSEVGIASDVFSLGVLLYEMTTGRRPFEGESDHRIVHAICEESPERPRRQNSRFPSDLEAVILRCLAKSPADRYGTAAELRKDLERFLEGTPVSAVRVTCWRQLRFLFRKHPVQAVGATLAVMLLIVSATVATFSWLQASQALAEKERALSNADMSLSVIHRSIYEVSESVNSGRTITHENHLTILLDLLEFHSAFAKLNPASDKAQHRLSVAHHHVADGFARLARYDDAVHHREECVNILGKLLENDSNNRNYLFQRAGGYLRIASEYGYVRPQEASRLAIEFRAKANVEIDRLLRLEPTNTDYLDFLAAARVGLAGSMLTNRKDEHITKLAAEGIAVSAQLWLKHPEQPAFAKHAITGKLILAQNVMWAGLYSRAEEHCRDAWQLYQQSLVQRRSESAVLDQEFLILSTWSDVMLNLHDWDETLRLIELAELNLGQQEGNGVTSESLNPTRIVLKSMKPIALRQLHRNSEADYESREIAHLFETIRGLSPGEMQRLNELNKFAQRISFASEE